MSEFKAIETQEELDRIIGELVSRAKEATKKEYEGFISPADLKTKTDDLANQITKLQTELDGQKTVIAEKDGKIKAYETASVKTKTARELGLPYEAIDFISGDDEESIKKSASALKTLFKSSGNGMPPASSEGGSSSDNDEYKEMLSAIRKD